MNSNPIKKIRDIIVGKLCKHPLAMTVKGKFVRTAMKLRKMDFEDIICIQNIPRAQRKNLVSVDIGGKLFVVDKNLAKAMNLSCVSAAWTEKMHQAHQQREENKKKKILERRKKRNERIRIREENELKRLKEIAERRAKAAVVVKEKKKSKKELQREKFKKFMKMQQIEKREKRKRRAEELKIEREKRDADRNTTGNET